MKLTKNQDFFKRASTYANLVTLVGGAVMSYFPQLGFSQPLTGYVMLSCGVVVAVAQFITFEAKKHV